MQPDDPLLLAALRAAPRRYHMPPLPASAEAAAAAGVEAALAFAIEAARAGQQHGAPPPAAVRDLFTSALANFIGDALAPEGGDAAFQALVLQAHAPQVQEYVPLAGDEPASQRTVRALVDAIAHPGKTRGLPAGALRDGLAQLHALATAGAWTELAAAAQQLQVQVGEGDAPLQAALQALLASPSLQRLQRLAQLRLLPLVRRYLALCALRGPAAGSRAAAAQGRSAARLGEVAERETVAAFHEIAALLDAQAGSARCRVVRSLRTPRGFPGEPGKAKDEWDVAIVRDADAPAGATIALLAEVKAAPAAAAPDFARLRRGLLRLAHADADAVYAFPCDEGELRIAGASLRALRPPGHALPPHVIYCCTAPPEARPALLSAASKAVLAAEPASLAFARRLAEGGAPPHTELAPVWEALTATPRLRSALHQYETACAVRQAMLHPVDLRAALAARLARAAE